MSGDRDANASLLIEPQGPGVRQTISPQGAFDAAVVQRMPVTKRVRRVTLGDFGRPADCSSGGSPAVWLNVWEYPNGDMSGLTTQRRLVAHTNSIPLPATPGKLVFDIPPTTLFKDLGYTFLLGGGCRTMEQTVWPKQGRVNPGPNQCTRGVGAGTRFWHVQGQDDRPPGCVFNNNYPYKVLFTPGMPTGWLLVHGTDQFRKDVVTHSHMWPPSGNHYYCGDPQRWAGAGLEEAFWRPNNGWDDYICRFTQYAPYGSEPDQGWFWGEPWKTASGPAPAQTSQPHDPYLKLETIDYDTLLERHAPIWAFDEGEGFYPQRASAFTANWEEGPEGEYLFTTDYVNTLFNEEGDEMAAAGSPWGEFYPPPLSLGIIGARYWFGDGVEPDSESTDYIDARGGEEETYSSDSIRQYDRGHDDIMYGRVLHDPDDGSLWLQYWTFYYFNSFNTLGIGRHEGDWEMVQVGLASDGTPEKMTFATHDYASRVPWAEVSKAGVTSQSPVVFVAARSHASYPESGSTSIDVEGAPDQTDNHEGNDVWKALPVEEINSESNWTGWRGRWGSSRTGPATSPMNPSEQGDVWSRPSTFHTNAREW